MKGKKQSKSNPAAFNTATRTYLAQQGYRIGKTENWNAFCGMKTDLFGFIDFVAIKKGEILAVQSTSIPNHAARYKKILSLPAALDWILGGGKILIISWEFKDNGVGKRKSKRVRLQEVTFADFDVPVVEMAS